MRPAVCASWLFPKLGACLSMASWPHVSGVFGDHIQILRDSFELKEKHRLNLHPVIVNVSQGVIAR